MHLFQLRQFISFYSVSVYCFGYTPGCHSLVWYAQNQGLCSWFSSLLTFELLYWEDLFLKWFSISFFFFDFPFLKWLLVVLLHDIFCSWFFLFQFFKKDFIYLIESEQERKQKQGQREREKQAPHWAESLMWGLIPGPWDHDLSLRQLLNQLSHLGPPLVQIFI